MTDFGEPWAAWPTVEGTFFRDLRLGAGAGELSMDDYGEPWTIVPMGDNTCLRDVHTKFGDWIGNMYSSYGGRIIHCINACQGMADPAAEIAAMRSENARLLALNQALVAEAERLREALQPFTARADEWDAKTGHEKPKEWLVSVKVDDCRRARAALERINA